MRMIWLLGIAPPKNVPFPMRTIDFLSVNVILLGILTVKKWFSEQRNIITTLRDNFIKFLNFKRERNKEKIINKKTILYNNKNVIKIVDLTIIKIHDNKKKIGSKNYKNKTERDKMYPQKQTNDMLVILYQSGPVIIRYLGLLRSLYFQLPRIF